MPSVCGALSNRELNGKVLKEKFLYLNRAWFRIRSAPQASKPAAFDFLTGLAAMLELEDPDDRPNLYTVLELDDTATSADIKRAFNRLSRLYHPDRNREADAPQQFGAVHHAYSILHDDRARKVYDSMKRCKCTF